jgi:hypothetical protein
MGSFSMVQAVTARPARGKLSYAITVMPISTRPLTDAEFADIESTLHELPEHFHFWLHIRRVTR